MIKKEGDTVHGYHFRPGQLSVAEKTIERFVERAIRLYERVPGKALASARFGLYVRRWVRWTGAGLSPATSDCLSTAQAGGPGQS